MYSFKDIQNIKEQLREQYQSKLFFSYLVILVLIAIIVKLVIA